MSAPERSASAQRADKCIAFGIQTWNEGAKLEALCSDCNGVSAVADLWKSERGYGEWVRTEDALKACETVARRRAIEELKALVSGHCTYCALGFELLVPSGGDDGYHMVGPEGSRCQQRCDAYGIIYRIAAIEAEEA
jgi:hypothetical protein